MSKQSFQCGHCFRFIENRSTMHMHFYVLNSFIFCSVLWPIRMGLFLLGQANKNQPLFHQECWAITCGYGHQSGFRRCLKQFLMIAGQVKCKVNFLRPSTCAFCALGALSGSSRGSYKNVFFSQGTQTLAQPGGGSERERETCFWRYSTQESQADKSQQEAKATEPSALALRALGSEIWHFNSSANAAFTCICIQIR